MVGTMVADFRSLLCYHYRFPKWQDQDARLKSNMLAHPGEESADSQRLMDLQRACDPELPVGMRCRIWENQVLVDDDVVSAELVCRVRPGRTHRRMSHHHPRLPGRPTR